MRILFVTPYPLSRIRVRPYSFVSQLRKSHDVTVLSLCSNKREQADVQALQREGIDVIAIEDNLIQKVFRVLAALGSDLPLQVAFDASPALKSTLAALLKAKKFDIMHVEFVRSLEALPEALPIPTVWDAVDCISRLYTYGAYFGVTTRMRILGYIEAHRLQAYERKQLQRFHHILVTSERDRQGLLALVNDNPSTANRGTAEVVVLPHSVDQQYFQRHVGARHPATLVFSGKMSFHANIAGALHLVKHIMPHIWRQRPDVQLVIAGSNPPFVVQKMARDPRIKVTGYVEDLRPYIAQATVAVSPLPYAVGIQNKVLEAMALGTPVVCSSCSIVGLQATKGQDVLVADDPELFASYVLQLLDDGLLWNQLSENGVSYVTTYHNSERVTNALLTAYSSAKEIFYMQDTKQQDTLHQEELSESIKEKNIWRSIQTRIRKKRFAFFQSLISSLPRPLSVLDVGGTQEFWEKVGFIKPDVSVLLYNLTQVETPYSQMKSMAGDARNMHEFKDKEFDVVFSNSVIEHVGTYQQQRQMAEEVQRVGKRYCVQTPNRYFPIEPHVLLPFFQFYPFGLKVFILSHFRTPWGWKIETKEEAIEYVNGIRLLTEKELRTLFPDAKIYKERFLGLCKSLTMYKGWDEEFL
ncbi:MAG TPA: glycosyltransferase [Ktedonobacteraceae bacterium]|nr:glycosyltransferase [Ktedonobacteraceae bacterium]